MNSQQESEMSAPESKKKSILKWNSAEWGTVINGK